MDINSLYDFNTSTSANGVQKDSPLQAGSKTEDEKADVGEEFSTFLSLLTAQIRNQDPLSPLDSTQFVQQLATFSSLELQATGNNHLEAIANMLALQLQSDNNGGDTATEPQSS